MVEYKDAQTEFSADIIKSNKTRNEKIEIVLLKAEFDKLDVDEDTKNKFINASSLEERVEIMKDYLK